MKKIIMLGTGHAMTFECFNTCFLIRDNDDYILVDTGEGNGILKQLKKLKIPLDAIHHLFLTHAHTDHIMGVPWLIRVVSSLIKSGKYQGKLHIYCHDLVKEAVVDMCRHTLGESIMNVFGDTIIIHEVIDGEQLNVLYSKVTFFDIHSKKMKQFGFTMEFLDGIRLSCLGDEPYNPIVKKYVKGSDWLLHEAFCLYSQKDIFHPYKISHSTCKDAGMDATNLGCKNLVLYHTEEQNLDSRKELYTKETKEFFNGNVFVPEDLEVIPIE